MNIRYLKNNEINYYRWDSCIKNSFNSHLFAYSWYLNTVCNDWDALIEGDYETVMPLPVLRRFGLMGVRTPHFISSLGIFSAQLISNEKIEAFFKAIPFKILFVNLNLNKFNRVTWSGAKIMEKSHFELDLVRPYNKLHRNYDQSLKDKLNTAKRYKLTALRSISPNEILDLCKSQEQYSYNPCYHEEIIKILRILISTSLRYRIGELIGVYDAFNNLCSAAFFVWSDNRAILLFSCTTPEGFEEQAFPFLIDHFVQLYSNKFITLIFDYSELPGCDKVFTLFGAIESHYQNIVIRRIPVISSILSRFRS